MDDGIKQTLWSQFGATVDMLGNAIAMHPEESWAHDKKFFYMAYHCLVFLDYYLTIPPVKVFASPLPFTLTSSDVAPKEAIDDVIPDRIFSKREMLAYLAATREKCRQVIGGLTEEKLGERWVEVEGNKNFSVLELLLYNMRHVQHHAAQLNTMLRQSINNSPGWVSRAEDGL